jgi:hypothetical protein
VLVAFLIRERAIWEATFDVGARRLGRALPAHHRVVWRFLILTDLAIGGLMIRTDGLGAGGAAKRIPVAGADGMARRLHPASLVTRRSSIPSPALRRGGDPTLTEVSSMYIGGGAILLIIIILLLILLL